MDSPKKVELTITAESMEDFYKFRDFALKFADDLPLAYIMLKADLIQALKDVESNMKEVK